MVKCDCPKCGSNRTQALNLIHANGLRRRKWRSGSLFYYRRSVGLGSTRGTGESQSLSSSLAAPPVPASTAFLRSPIPVALVFVLTLAAGWPGFWLSAAIVLLVAVLGGAAEEESQQRAQADWESTFRCSRCGFVFSVDEAVPSPHEPLAAEESPTGRVLSGPAAGPRPDAVPRHVTTGPRSARRFHGVERSSSGR
jgi:hypothetical protein